MKLIVKSLKGTQFEVETESTSTVEQLKQKIQEEQKLEAKTQKLVAVGKVMADDKTLDEYKLKDGDFIVVMISKPKVKKEKKPAPPAPVSAPAPTQPPQPAPTPSSTTAPAPAATTSSPSPAPAPATGGDGSAPGGGNGMMSAEELESTLTELQSMGFDRDKCMQALRAAFYNPDRAVDYLLNGIPAEPPAPANPAGADPGMASMGADGGAGAAEGAGAAGDLSFLSNNPMFGAIRDRIARDPAFFQTFMNQLAQTQPQIHQAISQNPQAFISLLLGGGGAGGAGGAEGGQDPPGTIRVTQEEKDAIDRLASLGFPKHRAIEAYLACDKNEEWAANYLFENVNADDQYDEQLVQDESAAEAQANNPGDAPPSNPPADAPMAGSDAPQNNAEQNMEVDQPAQNPPAENAPAENPPAENPPADNPPADNANNEGGANANNDGNDEDESCL